VKSKGFSIVFLATRMAKEVSGSYSMVMPICLSKLKLY
jgi:hypothetical protein